MIDNNKLIAERMKSRRNELHISIAQIAEETGLTKATLHRYESGEIRRIKVPIIETIAHILKVNPAWLIGKSEDKILKDPPIKLVSQSEEIKDVRVMLAKLVTKIATDDTLTYGDKPISNMLKLSLISSLETAVKLVDNMQDEK